MWFIVPLSTQAIVKIPFLVGKDRLKIIDQGWVERIGAQGLFKFIIGLFKKYQMWQSSLITIHLSIIIIFIFILFVLCSDSLIKA